MKSSIIGQDSLPRWPTFTSGAFLGFVFGVILGLSSCQSAECHSSVVEQPYPPVTARHTDTT